LKQYKTCHAIYWQKARIKRKDIDGSERLTGVCVCQWVNYWSAAATDHCLWALKINWKWIYINTNLRSLQIPNFHTVPTNTMIPTCVSTLRNIQHTHCATKIPQFITCSTVSPLRAVCPSRCVGCCLQSAPSAWRPPQDSAQAQSAGTQVLLRTPAVVTIRDKQCLICSVITIKI